MPDKISPGLEPMATPADELHLNEANPRLGATAAVARSLERFGQRVPIVYRVEDGRKVVVAGNHRLMAARQLGWDRIAAVSADDLTDEEAQAFALADNRTADLGTYDMDMLASLLEGIDDDLLAAASYDAGLSDVLSGPSGGPGGKSRPSREEAEEGRRSLSEAFLVPPLSVLDTRQGYWQERKRQWNALGLSSHEGRDENLLRMSESILNAWPESHGTSVFDPVLCEVAYRWYAPPNARILDPFAGGSVRGLTAAILGHSYTGIDLSAKQVEANEKQAGEILRRGDAPPRWLQGDSTRLGHVLGAGRNDYDMLFSCPPYHDLEQYSDDPHDLSNLSLEDFKEAHAAVWAKAAKRLKPNRFAVVVMGETRDASGALTSLIPHTIEALEAAGLSFYNDCILLNAVGHAALRAGRIFRGGRKVARIHQYVLVFVKGDWRKAHEALGVADLPEDLAL